MKTKNKNKNKKERKYIKTKSIVHNSNTRLYTNPVD